MTDPVAEAVARAIEGAGSLIFTSAGMRRLAQAAIAARLKALGEAGMVVCEKRSLRFAIPQGETLTEMRAHARETALYGEGDAVLRWVNEGDMHLVDMSAMIAAAEGK